jgi:hypothetical protein
MYRGVVPELRQNLFVGVQTFEACYFHSNPQNLNHKLRSLLFAKMANECGFTNAVLQDTFAKHVQDVSKNQLQYHDMT